MLKYKGMKTIDQIKQDAINQGWEIDFKKWDNDGDDWFWLRDMNNRMLQILVNCFGRFFVYSPASEHYIATEESTEFDNEAWYKEILDLLYEPKEEAI